MLMVGVTATRTDGDAMRVLDHLAGPIVSTHIPTGASATHVVELLLSHHDVPALLGFVNNTLVSTSPKPRNKVVSMWLIHTITRAMDTCLIKRLRKAIGLVLFTAVYTPIPYRQGSLEPLYGYGYGHTLIVIRPEVYGRIPYTGRCSPLRTENRIVILLCL